MKFIFENNRSPLEQRTFEASIRHKWLVSDIFRSGDVSTVHDETHRLKWAPVLTSLAFGESTAFYGFGHRIAEAADLSSKTWLTAHLLDEAKHTEGFSALLDYLYPSYRGEIHRLFQSRDVLLYYGNTHRCGSLIEWLICTQIAEVFGRHCYKEMASAFTIDPPMHQFFKNILKDESRHITYIGLLIDRQLNDASASSQCEDLRSFVTRMIRLGRNMFEGRRKGANFKTFDVLEIDVTAFCDRAETELANRLLMAESLPLV